MKRLDALVEALMVPLILAFVALGFWASYRLLAVMLADLP